MKRISRRNFLKAAGVGAAALGLAACGGSSSSTASSTASSAAASSAVAADVTIKVAAIETAYGSEMWQKVTDAFTAQTGWKMSSAPPCRAATTPTWSIWPPAVRLL